MPNTMHPQVIQTHTPQKKGFFQNFMTLATPFASAFGGPIGTAAAGLGNVLVGNTSIGSGVGSAIAGGAAEVGRPSYEDPTHVGSDYGMSLNSDYKPMGLEDPPEHKDAFSGPPAEHSYQYGTQQSIPPDDQQMIDEYLAKIESSDPEMAKYYREHPDKLYTFLQAVRNSGSQGQAIS